MTLREQEMPFKEVEKAESSGSSYLPMEVELQEGSGENGEGVEFSDSDEQAHEISDDESQEVPAEGDLDNYQLARDRTRRANVKKPARYSNSSLVYYAFCATEVVESVEPSNYKEAVKSRERDRWIKAMQDEIDSLLKNKTWILVTRKKLQKLIGYKWIF